MRKFTLFFLSMCAAVYLAVGATQVGAHEPDRYDSAMLCVNPATPDLAQAMAADCAVAETCLQRSSMDPGTEPDTHDIGGSGFTIGHDYYGRPRDVGWRNSAG